MEGAVKIAIRYDDMTEFVYCEKVSETIYRCIESCVFIDFINYGCEIEVEKDEEGELKFLWLYKESPFEKHILLLSADMVDSPGLTRMEKEIVEMGGQWERVMGGVFIFHLPKEMNDRLDLLYELLESDEGEGD